MYKFSPKLRLVSIILIILGAVLFGAGYAMNHSITPEKIEHMMTEMHASGHTEKSNSSEAQIKPNDHEAHLEAVEHQVHNRPLAAIHFMAVFAFGVSCAAMFFLGIQHASHAGWSVIVTRVMEAIGSYAPVGGIILIIIMILNVTHIGHLFHWMDPDVTKFGGPKFEDRKSVV